MNMENVPICVLAMYPPFQSTTASAREEARFIVTAKSPRRRAAPMALRRMRLVSVTKASAIVSSITSVLIVRAPVMPSLKFEVIWELISRISRLARVSPRWKTEKSSTASGSTAITISARRALIASITTTAPTT